MELIPLIEIPKLETDKKLKKQYVRFETLINALKEKDLQPEMVQRLNQKIAEINAFSGENNALKKRIQKSISELLKVLEKDYKLVPKSHYLTLGIALGCSFGVTFGAVFGASMTNMGLLGMGLPLGMALGLVIGSELDKKALKEGRQLNIEL